MLLQLVVLGLAAFAAAMPGTPPRPSRPDIDHPHTPPHHPTVSHIDHKRQDVAPYTLRCNGDFIWHKDAQACQDYLYAKGGNCGAIAKAGNEICKIGSCIVNLRVWDSNKDQEITCRQVADTMIPIWQQCKAFGGSMQSPNKNLIIHLQDTSPKKRLVVSHIDKRQSGYPLRCNGDNIADKDIQDCVDHLYDNTKKGISCYARARYGQVECRKGSAMVELRGWETDSTREVLCSEIADAVRSVWGQCKNKGGSAQAPDKHVIVHLTNARG